MTLWAAFLRTRLGQWLAIAGAVLLAVWAARWDAYRDGRRDQKLETNDVDENRAAETRRRVVAARERFERDGLREDDDRGFRD